MPRELTALCTLHERARSWTAPTEKATWALHTAPNDSRLFTGSDYRIDRVVRGAVLYSRNPYVPTRGCKLYSTVSVFSSSWEDQHLPLEFPVQFHMMLY